MINAIITTAGAALIAAKQAATEILNIDQFVCADIAGLDPDTTPPASTVMPDAADIVDQSAITQTGLIDEKTVAYSKVLGATMGDWYINWMGLYSSADNVLVAVAYVPRHLKFATDGFRAGNTLYKNFALEINNVSDLTGIVIDAESWQFDFDSVYAPLNHTHPASPANVSRGMIMSNNDVDPNYDIDISPGVRPDSTYAVYINLEAVITKQLDAAWAAGSNAGGLPAAVALTADTWYHCFVIRHADGTVDAGFDTDINAVNLLAASGYSYYYYAGSVLTDAISNIITGDWDDNDCFIWDSRSTDTYDFHATRVARTIQTPKGLPVVALLGLVVTADSTAAGIYSLIATALTQSDIAPNENNNDGVSKDGSYSEIRTSTRLELKTNNTSQIGIRCEVDAANYFYSINTIGYRFK